MGNALTSVEVCISDENRTLLNGNMNVKFVKG